MSFTIKGGFSTKDKDAMKKIGDLAFGKIGLKLGAVEKEETPNLDESDDLIPEAKPVTKKKSVRKKKQSKK